MRVRRGSSAIGSARPQNLIEPPRRRIATIKPLFGWFKGKLIRR